MQDKRKPQGNKTGELSSNDMRQAVLHLADSQGWEYSLSTTGELIPSLCPICLGGDNADRRSFAINLITGLSCCKRGSCGWEGNFSGLQKKLGLEPSETVDVTSSLTKSAMKELKRKAFVKPTITLLPPTREIIDYFAGRKISEATLKAFDISTTDGTRAGEIVFPFYFDNKKELIFVKYRKPKKWFKGCGWDKETRESNTMSILFGMNHCEFGKPLTITEGMLDSLSLYEAGIRNVVSVPSGAMDFNWIEHCWDWLENFSEIIIFGDNDQPGQEMVEALLRRLSGFTCRVVNDYPLRPDGDTPCKDANEVLYFHGDLAIWDMLDNAEGTPLKGVINLSDITPIDPTTVPRIKTNIATVDKTIGGIQAGTVTIFTGLSGSGKLLADDTPVMTSNGWKKHGELIVGDMVVSPAGRYVPITHVFPKGVANRKVTFTNGEVIYCHENHEWPLDYHTGYTHKKRILSTQQIASKIHYGGKSDTQLCNSLVLRTPMIGTEKELPVHPYALGAWLGDGRNSNPDICSPKIDKIVSDTIVECGYPISWSSIHKTTGVYYYGFKTLRHGLQTLGMCHSRKYNEKHIPTMYLTASYKQRMELLAGLLDTDGSLDNKGRCRYSFSTVSEKLRDSFCDLLSTFGFSYTIGSEQPRLSSSGIMGRQVVWKLSFSPDIYIPCRVERKQCKKLARKHRVSITGIEEIAPIQGNCIEVLGGLYCAGKTMLPTHNSTVTGQFVLSAIEQGEKVCVYSGELGPEDVQAWLNFQAAGSEYITLKYDPIAGGDVPYLSPQIQSRIRDWYNGKLYLFDDSQFENENQLESILSVFKMMARRIGAKLFLVDNVLTVTAEDDEEFRAQGRLIVALKHFAKKYGVAVLVVAHPRKKSTNGAHSAIMQDDVGGNGALVRLADNVIVVERPNLRIIKNRKTGVNKLVECVYCPDSRRIYEKSIGDRNHFSWDKKGIELPAVRADSIDEYREYFTTDNTPF